MQKNIIFSIVLLLFNLATNAQNDSVNRRELRPIGLSIDILGPTNYTSLNFDYFLDRNMSLELGGSQFGYYSGVKAHFGKKKSAGMIYVGLLYANVIMPETGFEFSHVYIPIGYHFVGKKGLNASVEIASNFNGSLAIESYSAYSLIYAQLRIGYRFKRKYSPNPEIKCGNDSPSSDK
jgi:hypothetical protein